MWNDDEQYYMEREFTGYDWRDSAPIEYVTESDEFLNDFGDEYEDDDPEYDEEFWN